MLNLSLLASIKLLLSDITSRRFATLKFLHSNTSYCVLPIGMKLYIKTNDIGPNNLNTLQKNNIFIRETY